MIRVILFDWGNTVMVDFELPGPMFEWEKVEWVTGAERSLQELSVIYPCYIATNAGKSDAAAVLKGLQRVGADRYFSGIFASSDIGYEKPDQLFFQTIIRNLDLLPEEIVMVGDSYIKDIEGAKRCGIRTVYLDVSGNSENTPMADAVIHNMGELPLALKKL